MSIVYHTRPFNTRYTIWQPDGRYAPEVMQTHRTAKAGWLYINRQHGIDDVGPTPDWSRRDDLILTGRCAPQRGDDHRLKGVALWEQADAHARQWRPTEPTCAHAVGSLPRHEGVEGWRHLIEGFCEDHLTSQGMIADWAIHHREETDQSPAILPHVHLLVTMRVFDPAHVECGKIRQTWLRTPDARKRFAERWWAASGLYPMCYGALK